MAVFALDSLLGFIPSWFAISAGTIIIFAILSRLQTDIITPVDKVLGNSRVQAFTNAVYGSVAYIWASLNDEFITGRGLEWLANSVLIVFLVASGVYFSARYLRYLTEDQLIEIWATYAGRKRVNKDWAAIRGAHDTWIRTLWILSFRYGPAAFIVITAFLCGVLVAALTFASALFAALLLVWMIIPVIASIIKRRNTEISVKMPDTQEHIIEAQLKSGGFASMKGLGPLICSIVGIGTACFWIYAGLSIGAYSYFETLINRTPDLTDKLLVIAVILPAGSYQLLYWYRILRRLPLFLALWETQDFTSVVSAQPLPKGGDWAFFTSCFVPLSVFLFPALHGYMAGISICTTLMFTFLIIGSLRDKFKETRCKKLSKDNFRIPLAFYSAACSIILFSILLSDLFYESSNLVKEMPVELLSGFLAVTVLCYDQDLERWIKKQRLRSWIRGILSYSSFALYILALLPVAIASASVGSRVAVWLVISVLLIFVLLSIIIQRKVIKSVR